MSLGMPMAPSVLLQMVGPRVANHVLERMHDAFPERFPLSPALAALAAGGEPAVARAGATHARADRRRRPRSGGRRSASPARGRRRAGGGRRGHGAAARRRLAVLPRGHHQASRPARHVRASVWAYVRGDESAEPWPRWPTTTGAFGSSSPTKRVRRICLGRLGLRQSEAEELADEPARAPPGRVPGRQHRVRVRLHRDAGGAGGTHRRKRAAGGGRDAVTVRHRALAPRRGALGRRARAARRRGRPDRAGIRPWEVRVEAGSLREAHDLAEALRAEGYDVSRTFTYVIAGAGSREEAVELARRVHGEVEPGGELVYEVQPQNPFAVFGGLGA